MILFSVFSTIGFLMLAISIYYGENLNAYIFCIIGFFIHGSSYAFSESVLLGFLKFFPADAMNQFSSGTGFSHLFSIVFIILTNSIYNHHANVSFYLSNLIKYA
jgi:hypothetical protein